MTDLDNVEDVIKFVSDIKNANVSELGDKLVAFGEFFDSLDDDSKRVAAMYLLGFAIHG